GNEPNLPGQDDVGALTYAQQLHTFAARLREADLRAKIVAANPMNWDAECIGCGGSGFVTGHAWASRFLDVYRRMYGSPPPIDVWGVHSYDLDWRHTPMVDEAPLESDLLAMRADLDAIPSERGKPIWVTEFGVVWGYEGYAVQQVGSESRLVPRG